MGQREYFWIDGERCDTFGLRLQRPLIFSGPAPKMETISVPGRSGNLHYYEGAFENVEGQADCFALQAREVEKALAAITRWALLEPGYHRLETTEEPEIYRLAAVTKGPETEIRMRVLAPFSLTFDCKPQRFLKSGELPITLTESGGELVNEGFPALPLITVTGGGKGGLTIGGVTVSFKAGFSGPVVLDCESQNAYYGPVNMNNQISAPAFPILPHGRCTVSWTGGVDGVTIVPRWWTL